MASSLDIVPSLATTAASDGPEPIEDLIKILILISRFLDSFCSSLQQRRIGLPVLHEREMNEFLQWCYVHASKHSLKVTVT